MSETHFKLSDLLHPNAVRWQCRRGMLELDILLLRFFEQNYHTINETLQRRFRELLTATDQDLYDWLIKKIRHPQSEFQEMIESILLLH